MCQALSSRTEFQKEPLGNYIPDLWKFRDQSQVDGGEVSGGLEQSQSRWAISWVKGEGEK